MGLGKVRYTPHEVGLNQTSEKLKKKTDNFSKFYFSEFSDVPFKLTPHELNLTLCKITFAILCAIICDTCRQKRV